MKSSRRSRKGCKTWVTCEAKFPGRCHDTVTKFTTQSANLQILQTTESMTNASSPFRLSAVLVMLLLTSLRAQELPYGYVPNLGTGKKTFTFGIWGDPQVAFYAAGSKFDNPQNQAIFTTVNPRLQQTVALTNQLAPEFVITLGDNIHNFGERENFQIFTELVKGLQMPLYLLMGNHDHVPAADAYENNPFGDREFGNFIWAQKQINGLEKVVYSFDAGDWHMVLYSQPGGSGYGVDQYMARHPEFLQWLEADLQANRHRPTMFFTHHPLLPVGRDQFDHYGPGPRQRATLVDILTRHGNVKYAFFGHVHNTVASIPKISWRYKGSAFIIMPNAALFARVEDYQETVQSSWGLGMVQIDGPRCEAITFHTLAGETVAIDPGTFEEYDDTPYAFLRSEADLPAADSLLNGSFEQPLREGWLLNHLLAYDTPPVEKREIRNGNAAAGQNYLYLYTKANALRTDSPSYLYSSIRQTVAAPGHDLWPVLKLKYKIDSTEYVNPQACNAFIAISGNRKDQRRKAFTLVYSLGRDFMLYGVRWPYSCLKIPPVMNQWNSLAFDVRADYKKKFPDAPWEQLRLDNLTVTLAVINDNYSIAGKAAEIGVSFDEVTWQAFPETSVVSGNHEAVLPNVFALHENHPNPYAASTKISFVLLAPAEVTLKICDPAGRLVENVETRQMSIGAHTITWNAPKNLASGVYFAMLSTPSHTSVRKMLLIR